MGEVEIRTESGAIVGTLKAGEYFGENALLEHRDVHRRCVASVCLPMVTYPTHERMAASCSCLRCKTPCDVLKLPQGDFEAVLKAHTDQSSCNQDRARMVAFVKMFSPHKTVQCAQGSPVFRQGQKVKSAFYVVESGELTTSSLKLGQSSAVKLAVLRPGECFGEVGLLKDCQKDCQKDLWREDFTHDFTVECSKGPCDVVTFAGPHIARLLEKSIWFRVHLDELARQRRAHEKSVHAKRSFATSMGSSSLVFLSASASNVSEGEPESPRSRRERRYRQT